MSTSRRLAENPHFAHFTNEFDILDARNPTNIPPNSVLLNILWWRWWLLKLRKSINRICDLDLVGNGESLAEILRLFLLVFITHKKRVSRCFKNEQTTVIQINLKTLLTSNGLTMYLLPECIMHTLHVGSCASCRMSWQSAR